MREHLPQINSNSSSPNAKKESLCSELKTGAVEQLAGELVELRREVTFLKTTVVEQRSLCASLAAAVTQVPALEASINEVRGVQSSFDVEQQERFAGMTEFKEDAERRLSSLAAELRQAVSTSKGDIRRTRDDLEAKILEPQRQFKKDLKEVKAQLQVEIQVQANKQENARVEMMHIIHNVQRDVDKLRLELEASKDACMRHADARQAEMRAAFEERARVVNEAFESERQETLKTEAALDAALKAYTNDLCTPLGYRIDATNSLLAQTHKGLNDDIEQAKEAAKQEARFSTEAALQRVDDHLQEFVHKASDALLIRVKETSTKVSEQVKEQPEDIIQGFYGLLARESVDAELQTMVDRALHRLQLVSDDLSHRSCRLQEHIDASELRIKTYMDQTVHQLPAGAESSPPVPPAAPPVVLAS